MDKIKCVNDIICTRTLKNHYNTVENYIAALLYARNIGYNTITLYIGIMFFHNIIYWTSSHTTVHWRRAKVYRLYIDNYNELPDEQGIEIVNFHSIF